MEVDVCLHICLTETEITSNILLQIPVTFPEIQKERKVVI